MEDNRYFKNALEDFAFDVAYADSIRHLHKSGYSPEEIKKHLDSPSLSIDRIVDVIKKDNLYSNESSINNNNNSKNNTCHYEYVKEYDSYGHSNFIRKRIDNP